MFKSTTSTNKPKSTANKLVDTTSPQYHALVRRLQVIGGICDELEPQVIGITSSTQGEGVTTVACNLAIAAAKADCGPVLLIDSNVERPGIGSSLRISSRLGFINVMAAERSFFDVIHKSTIDNLAVMLPGELTEPSVTPSYDILKIRDLFENLKHNYQTIIVDLPPAQPLTTCISLASCANGLLWVMDANRADRDILLRTSRSFSEANTNVLGVIYNKSRNHVIE